MDSVRRKAVVTTYRSDIAPTRISSTPAFRPCISTAPPTVPTASAAIVATNGATDPVPAPPPRLTRIVLLMSVAGTTTGIAKRGPNTAESTGIAISGNPNPTVPLTVAATQTTTATNRTCGRS